MSIDLMSIDFFSRKAVRYLWKFRGVDTGCDSCSGHLEHGSRNSCDSITQYIPGLKAAGYQKWEFEGKPVDLETFTTPSFVNRDNLIIRPLEEVYSNTINRENLKWTTLRLYFTEFDTEFAETKKLKEELQKIFSTYRDILDLGFNEKNSFYGRGINGTNHSVEELIKRQNDAIAFWKSIETACKDILIENGIDP